jgi:hypothetical protein
MRNNWLMTRFETAMFITGVMLFAGGLCGERAGDHSAAKQARPAGRSGRFFPAGARAFRALTMVRKVTIALLAAAALGMLAPDVVSARGGGGGGHGGYGGFHGGYGGYGGFHGGYSRFYGGRFHRGHGIGRDGFRAGRFGRGGSRFEKHMMGSHGQGKMHCITSDCNITHTYRD